MSHNALQKIIIASGTYPPEVSGQSTFVAGLVAALRVAEPEMKVVVMAYGEQEVYDNNVFLARRDRWRHLRYLRLILRQRRGAQIIYAQDLVSSGFPAAVASWLTGIPLVVRIGGDFLWEQMVERGICNTTLRQYYAAPKSLREKIILAIYRFVFQRASLVVFNTEWQQQLYQSVFGLAPSTTTVIINIMPSLPRATVTTPGNDIIFAGRFVAFKNLLRLVQAFRTTNIPYRLALIGDGPLRSHLERLAVGDDRIQIESPLAGVALYERLATARAVVVPSLTEINPNVGWEALALGVPLVVTSENGMPTEWQQYLWRFNPLDEADLARVLTEVADEQQWQMRKDHVHALPAPLTWPQSAATHLQLFDQICAS